MNRLLLLAIAWLVLGALWIFHVALIPVGAAIVLWKHGKVTRELMQPYLVMP